MSLCKTLVRAHCRVLFKRLDFGAHSTKDKELIEKIQDRFTKMIRNMEGKSYEDRLRYLGL